jgi:FdhE protein
LWEDDSRMVSLPKPGPQRSQGHWESRIQRARELRESQPAAAAMLRLYEAALTFQSEVARASDAEFRSGIPLREQIDPAFASSFMASLLQLTIQHGPADLGRKAGILQQEGEPSWRRIVESEIAPGTQEGAPVEGFFARACLQPIAEKLQSQLPPDPNYSQNLCPACGSFPQLAVLRPEGEGASRWLLCSFCLREWLFRRIICPWCGEEDKDKLPRYSAEECAYVHVQACDTCKRYVKAVDMTIDGRAVPLVDEAALAVLDVWAADHDYTKVLPNLLGF